MASNEKIKQLALNKRAEGQNPTPLEALMMLRDNAHTGLDIGGMVPGVGGVADLANAGLYASEGDKFNTGLSLAAATPLAGLTAGAGKLFQQIYSKMQRIGVGGLNRTETSYIKKNFDKFKDHINLKQHEKRTSNEQINFELDYAEEAMEEAQYENMMDQDLDALYETMKKSSKGNFSKGTGQLNEELSKHGGGTYKPETRSQRMRTNPGKKGGHGGGSYGPGGGGPRGIY